MKKELLAKYNLGEANTKEGQRVEEWLGESEDHQREFRQLKRRIELGSKRYKYGVFAPRQAIQKVIFPAKTHYLRILPVAASIIVLIFGVLWFWNKSSLQETVLLSRTGETKVFYLPDSSRVMLSGDSRLTYNAQFGKTNRELSLRGEAFFQVKRDTSKPFIVETSRMNVKVLGTRFNVNDYDDNEEVSTTLVNGSVEIVSGDQQVFRLVPGEQAYGKENKLEKREVNVRLYTSWIDGKFLFNNTELEEIAQQISRWYDVEIFFSSENVKKVRFTGAIVKFKPLDDLVRMIESTSQVRFSVKGKTIVISE